MEDQRKVTQDILQTTTLMNIQDSLETMTRLIASTVAKGELIPVGSVQVTSALYEVSLSNPAYDTLPWKGVTIYNDGPSAYYIAINADYIQNPTPINQGEPFQADMGTDKIRKILLQAAVPGSVANLRIIAVK